MCQASLGLLSAQVILHVQSMWQHDLIWAAEVINSSITAQTVSHVQHITSHSPGAAVAWSRPLMSNQSSQLFIVSSTHRHHHRHHDPPASRQAKAVQDHIRAHNIRVDLVIVSPLTRALETAVGCFGNLSGPLNGTAPLMAALTEVPGVRTAHPAVGAEGCPPFVCYELCREHLGVHPCDKRYPISLKQQMFPGE